MKLTYILVLNWNGWPDTIKCLESLLKINYSGYKIVVCDNNSTDNSVFHIENWVKNKKIYDNYISFNYDGSKFLSNDLINENHNIILIKNNENTGYAGGNNVGIQFILEKKNFEFIWILNNDTYVDCESLNYLVKKMYGDSSLGICGSLLVHDDDPSLIQAYGAKYSKWLARSSHIAEGVSRSNLNRFLKEKIDFTVGASMLVSHSFISSVGLMCEDYFLYFEELDWITRADNNYSIDIEPLSVVYHKQGASTGATGMIVRRSGISQYYNTRGRVLFTKKFHKIFLPTVLFSIGVSFFFSVFRRDWTSAKSIVKGVVDGSLGVTGRRDAI